MGKKSVAVWLQLFSLTIAWLKDERWHRGPTKSKSSENRCRLAGSLGPLALTALHFEPTQKTNKTGGRWHQRQEIFHLEEHVKQNNMKAETAKNLLKITTKSETTANFPWVCPDDWGVTEVYNGRFHRAVTTHDRGLRERGFGYPQQIYAAVADCHGKAAFACRLHQSPTQRKEAGWDVLQHQMLEEIQFCSLGERWTARRTTQHRQVQSFCEKPCAGNMRLLWRMAWHSLGQTRWIMTHPERLWWW